MRTGLWELVVVWQNGDKDIWEYEDEHKAVEIETGLRIANGNQIQWTGVRPKLTK